MTQETRRYQTDFLLFLRDSPLVQKPEGLPPKEEYLGPSQPENTRTNLRPSADRQRGDYPLHDQTNRRPGLDRHVTRGNANPEDIVLGPPKTSFPSTSTFRPRGSDSERNPRDQDSGRDRLGFRSKNVDADDTGDRFRDNRNNSYRRRGDADQDSDGWSTVKPRKSFGHEGAERFHNGRMGGERFSSDRRARDKDDRDGNRDRPQRTFDNYTRDRDNGDGDPPRRNGLNRTRGDAPWHKDNDGMSQRERIDKVKDWRARDENADVARDRGNDRYDRDRRWNREHRDRQDSEAPEWLDAPADGPAQPAMNQAEFQKFMEDLKKSNGATKPPEPTKEPTPEPEAEPEPPQIDSPSEPPVDKPDKFFQKFGAPTDTPAEATKETTAPRPKMAGASRFTSFFATQQESSRRPPEPPTPSATLPQPNIPTEAASTDADKVAFQALLQKLQAQTLNHAASPPGGANIAEPPAMPAPISILQDQGPPPGIRSQPPQQHVSPDPFQQFGTGRRDDPRMRLPPMQLPQEVPPPRSMMPSNPPSARPDQNHVLQDLINHRQNTQSQGSSRTEQTTRNNNTEFLMGLMQSARNMPDPPRTEQLMVRMPQPTKQAPLLPMVEREPDFLRAVPQRPMPQAPPGFMDEPFHHIESDGRRQPQPTQILQRPPPGLDLPSWMNLGGPNSSAGLGGPGPNAPGAAGAHMAPHQQRPMIPPPGLLGNSHRAGPPPGMFPPPNFGGFPPEGMVGPPPRNMQPPPGLYGGPPPPGFMPPPGMGGFQGPEGMPFGGPADARGMPPPFMRRP